MKNSDAGARVVEVVSVLFNRQQRIDHRDYRADFGCTKPASDKLRRVGQNEEHAVFNIGAKLTQQVACTIRLPRDLIVSQALIAEAQTNFMAAPGSEIVVEKVLGHIEAFRESNHVTPYTAEMASD